MNPLAIAACVFAIVFVCIVAAFQIVQDLGDSVGKFLKGLWPK